VRVLQKNRRAEVYATADAGGAATCVVNIANGPSWEVKQITVTNTGALIPSAATYVGSSPSGVPISSTLIADSDTDSQPNITLRSGESLCAVFAE